VSGEKRWPERSTDRYRPARQTNACKNRSHRNDQVHEKGIETARFSISHLRERVGFGPVAADGRMLSSLWEKKRFRGQVREPLNFLKPVLIANRCDLQHIRWFL
jgi:hypothetical protein